MSKIKIFALGGLDESGKNMYVLEVGRSIFVIEAGIKFPESSDLGVDMIVADFDYLIKRKKDVKGFFITHAHDDAMLALPYLLDKIEAPIYGSDLTLGLIQDLLEDYVNDLTPKLYVMKEDRFLTFGNVKVHPFKVTHSINGSVGLAFETPQGHIIFTGDYIVDFGAPSPYQMDIAKLAQFAQKGVLVLMTESVGAERRGHTSPHHQLSTRIESTISETKGRILVSIYTQNVFNVNELILLAIKYDKKIIFYNTELEKIFRRLTKLKQISIPKENLGKVSDIGVDDQNAIIVISGSGEQLFVQLHKIANGYDNNLEISETDTVILAAPPIPGTERVASQTIDELYKTAANIIMLKSKTFISMHASQEDLKMMINILKPKYYMPVKGEYRQLIMNAKVAEEVGYQSENILILDNGEVAVFSEKELEEKRERVDVGDILVDGIGVGDVSSIVINDRKQLSSDGVIVIGVSVDKKYNIVAGPDVQTRGFIHLKSHDYVLDHVSKTVEIVMAEISQAQTRMEYADVRNTIKDRVSRYVMKETGKRPMILTMIVVLTKS